jgi:hypothetical protein
VRLGLVKEYGGFLPLELKKGSDYFEKYKNIFSVVKLNCGRSTFFYAAKTIQPKKIYVPYLNCIDSVTPFEKLGIPYEFYFLDNELLPLDVAPGKDEAILWINYYGNASVDKIRKVCLLFKDTNLIIDNCHAFYAEPQQGAYNCYSARKFFGVCDGAYLIADDLDKILLNKSYSAQYYSFILESIELGTNAVYEKNLENEDRLRCDSVLEMSEITQRILQSINYEDIKNVRRRNFIEMHRCLESINEFEANLDSHTHMYYPLLVSNPLLRNRLIENKIYTPTWWRHVLEYFDESVLEAKLSKYMLMLPIDQRYNISDMQEIARIVIKENNRRG